jgi:hypothetical protein
VKIEEPEPSPAKPAELLRNKSTDANAKGAHPKEPATPTGRAAVAVTAAGGKATDGAAAAASATAAAGPIPPMPPSPMALRQDQSLPSSRHVSH